MKILLTLIVLLLIVGGVAALYYKYRAKPGVTLTKDEALILETIRENYGEKIIGESITDSNGDKVLRVELGNHDVAEAAINLSSLARKHREEGLTLPVIKMTLP
ncbi:MAG: hypothetical protein CMJ46_03735 [Planctomyces sp.]|nr:hypothetical protein [Planctomyces sp.]